MSERYVKVFSGEPNLYTENAPVVILASALLKDTETGKMIAQLKFQNISGKVITYAKVAITPLDAIQNALGDAVAFEYLDLSIADKDDFGSKKPLPLPNASTRAFRVGVSTVGFADGSVWTGDNTDWKFAAEDSAVSKAVEVETTYKKALTLSKSKSIEDVKKAKEIFESIQADKDVAMEISFCDGRIADFTAKTYEKKKAAKLTAFIAVGLIFLVLLSYFVVYPFVAYKAGDYAVYINMYNVKEFTVPDGVTSIDFFAFQDFDTLESVIISDSVTSIGGYAFEGCDELRSVTIPDSVTIIYDNAFYRCDELISITIPDSVTRIGSSAFQACEKLKSVTLGSGLTQINNQVFCMCSNLESITIPVSITQIDKDVFYRCSSLSDIYYGGTMEQWGDISKHNTWDDYFLNYTIHCTDGDIQYESRW